MNFTSGFWRLAWKEYRSQRSLWLAVLILTALVELIISLVVTLTNSDPIPSSGHLVVAFAAVVVYLLGCGATLFALEHESGTFDFQRLLPVSTWHVYGAKLGVGFLSGLGLMAALLVFEHAFYVGWHAVLAPIDWGAALVNFSEVFLWAVLFSLVMRHPLRAAVASMVAMSVNLCVVLPLAHTLSPTWDGDLLRFHRNFLGIRLGIICVLLAVDTWLAWRWFHGKTGFSFRRWRPSWSGRSSDYWIVPVGSLPAYTRGWPIGWWRLIGITWRQGRWILVLMCGLFLWAFVWQLPRGFHSGELTGVIVIPLILSAIVFGLCSFTFDQWSDQFRFYAERGVSPRWLWLSRHAVWFPPVLVQSVAVQWMASSQSTWSPADDFMFRWGCIFGGLTAYALSQLCAMFVRSTLVAFVVSIFAVFVGWCWMVIMVSLGIPAWFSLLPVPLLALYTTWHFAANWIEERKGLRHWLRVAAIVGVPSLIVLASCALYRAYEIPLVDPGFSVTEYTRPLTAAERGTLQIYEEADREIVRRYQAGPLGQEWLDRVRPVFTRLEEAHERTPAPLTLVKGSSSPRPNVSRSVENLGDYNPGAFLLLTRLQAESLTREEKLNEAWRCYEIGIELLNRWRLRADELSLRLASGEEKALLNGIIRWSAHPKQTTERIKVALARLEGLDAKESAAHRRTKVHYVLWKQFLDGEHIDPTWIGLMPQEEKTIQLLSRLMPWERTRFRRVLNLSALQILNPEAVPPQYRDQHRAESDGYAPLLRFGALWDLDIEIVIHRRATQLLIAIADYQRTERKLPQNLQVLVGSYFRQLPGSPPTDPPFRLFPQGVQVDIQMNNTGLPIDSSYVLPSGTPFLWFPRRFGPEIVQLPDGTYQVQSAAITMPLAETLAEGIIWKIPSAEAETL